MFKNYFKTTLRNIRRHKGYSFINISGLAVGMACCLLILMFVRDELSYDAYNEKGDRIYRIALTGKFGGQDFNQANIPAPMAKTLVNDYPEVEEAVRFRRPNKYIVSYNDNSFKEENIGFTDPSFFKVFTFPLLAGNPETVLKEPYTVVLSKKSAEKYFGKENPVGKILKFDNKEDFRVTGIYDQFPHNSHLHFDMLASMDTLAESKQPIWVSNNFNTYILLDKNADAKSLEAKFPQVIKKYLAPQVEQLMGKSLDELIKSGSAEIYFYLQPLLDIHLRSDLRGELEPNSDITYVYIFSAIALFILIIAAINFINLSTARSAGRAKEIGIRKVLGSFRSHVIRQFLMESMILSIIALIIAVILVNAAFPFFNDLSGKELTTADFFNWQMILAAAAVVLLTGFLAGAYPAFFLSAFQPVNVLKGQVKPGAKPGLLRNALVVFQFVASIVLIIGTLVVFNQLDYIRNKKIGFNKDQVFILHNAYLLGGQAESFKNELLKNASVENATISGYLPMPSTRNNNVVFPEGKAANQTNTSMEIWTVDHGYINTLGMKILKGRNFSKDFATDQNAMIINQSAVKQFGFDNAIGQRLCRFINTKGDVATYTVIGVVENFHYQSLRKTIAPLVMFPGNNNEMISCRLNTHDIAGTIDFIREQWHKFIPGQPFEYSFLDEKFFAVYRAEQRLGKIFSVFAFLAVVIACLGLFGLAAFIAQQRTKEIGIRKVLGASVAGIIQLLSKNFIVLVLIANIIAWPFAYLIMNKWLQDFAYRTPLSILTFIYAGIIAIIIALFTVGFQSVKAALSDPVKSIKYE